MSRLLLSLISHCNVFSNSYCREGQGCYCWDSFQSAKGKRMNCTFIPFFPFSFSTPRAIKHFKVFFTCVISETNQPDWLLGKPVQQMLQNTRPLSIFLKHILIFSVIEVNSKGSLLNIRRLSGLA